MRIIDANVVHEAGVVGSTLRGKGKGVGPVEQQARWQIHTQPAFFLAGEYEIANRGAVECDSDVVRQPEENAL